MYKIYNTQIYIFTINKEFFLKLVIYFLLRVIVFRYGVRFKKI